METNHTFQTVLSEQDFFLRDHRVLGDAVLPGSAYLEMARAAALNSEFPQVAGLRNVVWRAPAIVGNQPYPIRIALAGSGQKFHFSVHGGEQGECLHCQGDIVAAAEGERRAAPSPLQTGALMARCGQTWTGAELYAFFDRQGMRYGDSFRCIEMLGRGEDEVVATFNLAAGEREGAELFGLHPGIVDSALQSTVGLLLQDVRSAARSQDVYLPFAVKEVLLYGDTPLAGYVHARWSPGASRDGVLKFDIDIADRCGEVRVSIREFSSRRADRGAQAESLFGTCVWEDRPAVAQEGGAKSLAMVVGQNGDFAGLLPEHVDLVRLDGVFDAQRHLSGERVASLLVQALDGVRPLLSSGQPPQGRIVALVPSGDEAYPYAALAGLLKTLRLEHRGLQTKLLFAPAGLPAQERARLLNVELQASFDEVEVRYDAEGRRAVRRFVETSLPEPGPGVFRAGGVYWISGGLGGLGRILAEYIAATANVRLVLSGRSEPSEEHRLWLDRLRAAGTAVDYFRADVGDKTALRACLDAIKARHGELSGIIHCAGVVRDGYLVNKTPEQVREVFAAKVAGLLAIDEATRDERLDFLLLFSSISAIWGNAGQADYAGANAFLDAFAAHRNRLLEQGRRFGKTVSINWPLWREGGMRVDAQSEQLAQRAYGFGLLERQSGLDGLERAMTAGLDQVAVLSGDAQRIRGQVLSNAGSEHSPAGRPQVGQATGAAEWDARVGRVLAQSVGRVLKIRESEIELDQELSTYGFDSISLTELSNLLSVELGVELLPTIFYEYPSLLALKAFLLEDHLGALSAKLQPAAEAPASRPEAPSARAPSMPERAPEKPEASAGIAIVGISARFPQARDVDAFWRNLLDGRDCIELIPEDRWDWRAVYGDPHTEVNKTTVKWGGFIDDIAAFDPLFFGISPKEAELMDPQHRLLMEHVWSAMEDAGYSSKALSGTRTGMFLAIGPGGYRQPASLAMESYSATGSVPSMAPNRISFLLNLKGPSEPVETACSSSLVAVHRAVQAIEAGHCEQAFVGGVNAIVGPELHICFSKAGMLSEQGRCKTFSRDADGYARGEGVGVLFLKRLRQARLDGDTVYGLILGSNVNHGGRAASLTAPNAQAQAELLIEAYQRSGVDIDTISYIETHGTGTPLGDPVEINGLKKAFQALYAQQGRTMAGPHCGLGSVKTNIGHLEVAAGMAGLCKVLLAMRHGELPPTLHCEETNPYIDLADSPFYLLKQRQAWTRQETADGRPVPRRAGISSFGFGGTNAHVIIGECLDEERDAGRSAADAPIRLIPLSARSEERLLAYAAELLGFLDAVAGDGAEGAKRARPGPSLLADIAYTLQLGRDAMAYRLVLLAASVEDLRRKLRSLVDGSHDVEDCFIGQTREERDSIRLLNADESARELVASWMEKGKFGNLAEMWVAGLEIDWSRLYGARPPRRISLPTYPFARERYWLPELGAAAATPPAPAPAQPAALLEGEEYWQAAAAGPAVDVERLTLLHFCDDDAESAQLAQRLRRPLLQIRSGDATRRLGPQRYQAAGCDEAAFDALFALLKADGAAAGGYGVLYRWAEGQPRLPALRAVLRAAVGASLPLRYLQLSGRLEAGALGSCHDLSQIGFERSLGLTLPQLDVGVLFGDAGGLSVEQIAAEWGRPGVTRYQGGERQRLAWRPLAAEAAPALSPLRSRGVYLISGGGGGLGELFAGHLAQRCQGRIALLGRRPADAGMEARLARLRAQGASEAVYYQADVAEREQVERVIADVVGRWGGVHGIVHAAGLESTRSLLEQDADGFAEVLRAKLDGTRALDESSAGLALDFVCYFSSSAAALGDGGGCDYASANRFLMAYADYREAQRTAGRRQGRTVALCWPLWRAGGMGAVGSEAIEHYLRSSGQRYLEQAEGLQAWERALHGGQGQRLVLAGEPQRLRAMLNRRYGVEAARPAAGELGPQVLADVQGRIAAILKLPLERQRADSNFADLGFDSIGLAQLSRQLSAHFGFDVAPSVFFNYSTPARLSQHLAETQRAALSARYAVAEERVEPVEMVEPAAPVATAAAEAGDGVAIIGLSVRTAGAEDADELWRLLLEGRKQIAEVPAERWDWRPYYGGAGAADNRIASNRGAFLAELDAFDSLFFEISPREAQWMDPRQRLMLQEAWRAFEDAGYTGARLRGSDCGVYIGVEESAAQPEASGLATSHHNGILAARISYVLDLKGPNLALNTACSSGLAAVHSACQSVLRGECGMALAGGVNVLNSPLTYLALSQSGMLSSDGECYAFDERANGLVPGEAVAAVVLKRESQARGDGDAIYGVIRASGMNYDGRTNGITAPSGLAQRQLIVDVLRRGGIDAGQVGYVLGHSVGSPMGDPIEAQALGEALQGGHCVLGSIKPLIGHTFAASGVVSLIGMCLALKHRRMPGTANYRQANAYIDAANGPLRIEPAAQPWEGRCRHGLVGATGMSGTNVLVLLGEGEPEAAAERDGEALLVLSAREEAVLRRYAEKLRGYLQREPGSGLADVARALRTGREAMACRLAVVASSREAASAALARYLAAGADEDLSAGGVFATGRPGAAAGEGEDLRARAARWVAGGELAEPDDGGGRRRLAGLPTYPFGRRSLPEERVAAGPEAGERRPASAPGDKAAEYYTFDAQLRSDDYREEYLTFCPFEEEIPGFSMTRVLSAPAVYADEYRRVLAKQIEMRRVIFRHERFESVRRALDIGCGCGTDIIELAKRHPHVTADGFTITPAQEALANRRIRGIGLQQRVRVMHADSSRDRFPAVYELIIGFEVSCHIADKVSLFRNIRAALAPTGSVLLMDFIANLRGSIVDSNVDIAISPEAEWLDLLADNGLLLDDLVDLSPEIANYVFDPDVEKNVANFPEAARRSSRNFANMAISLREKWISYCLFRLTRDPLNRPLDELRAHNAAKMKNKTRYAEALAGLNDAAGAAAVAVEAPAAAGQAELVDRLEEIFRATLQLTRAELRAAGSFAAMGVDSLMAVRLLEAINTEFDLREPTSIMFQYHDLPSLAGHLAGKSIAAKAALEPVARPQAPQRQGIAVVGLSCRCAGASDQTEFWDLIVNGRECVESMAERRPEWSGVFAGHAVDPASLRGGFIAEADCFDSLFFDIAPVEAEQMDSSQRLVLEGIYTALEDAGYDPSALARRRVGTFIGSMGLGAGSGSLSHHAMLGSDGAILSSRIAYHLNLSGPAMTVNTACSSSLVAIELACERLRTGDIDMAIAGGVTLYSQPASFLMMHNAGMLSPSGRCRPFDDEADGIVVGDGVGIVVLMPLDGAVAEGARIYGLIRAIGTNQDGKTSGITAPSFQAQSRLEVEVYRKAGISPEQLQYVEAHGTGTKLGDPVEIHALSEAFRSFTDKRGFCALGSLKANIGHTTAASGVLGLIKVLLALKHRRIPPAVNFARPNRHIDFADGPFHVDTRSREWRAGPDGRRMAAVSAFGFSGTNAHLVVEEHVASRPQGGGGGRRIVPLSARKPEQLREQAGRLAACVRQGGVELADLAWTLQVGREAMACRAAWIVEDLDELACGLAAYLAGDAVGGVFGAEGGAGDGLTATARAWVDGAAVDWPAGRGAGRVSLPTYPFERVRFPAPAAAGQPAAAGIASGRRRGFVGKAWVQAPALPSAVEPFAGRRCAILATPRLEPLVRLLRQRLPGAEVLMPDQLASASQDRARWSGYGGCVDLTALDAAHRDGDGDWLVWLQKLIEHAPAGLGQSLFLSQWTCRQERLGNDAAALAGAGRTGLYRMLQSEYGRVASRHIDTDLAMPGDASALCAQIVGELSAADGESEVCYRGGVRHRAEMRWLDEDGATGAAPACPAGGVLWITGGTRGIGMLCARHFAERHSVRKLVLQGRQALPERSQWQACLAASGDDALRRKLENILALEALGVEVRIVSAALTDPDGMRQELAAVRREMGEVFGIIHAAGHVDFSNPAFIRKSPDQIDRVVAPKIRGVEVLREVFGQQRLKFVLLFSSVAAALPSLSVGQGEYAMANAYLDYAAAGSFGPGVEHCVSIQWPSWEQTGMGAANSAAYRNLGLLTCRDSEGLDFLDQILARGLQPVVMPLLVDPAVFDTDRLLRRAEPRATLAQAAPVSQPAEAGLDEIVGAWLKRLVSEELKVELGQIEPERTFDEYGVDSIMLAQMIQKMDRSLPGIRIDPTSVLENPSVARLSQYLAATHGRELERVFAATRQAIAAPASPERSDKVAIVGMACHFPGAPDIGQFWRNLCEGRDCIAEVPASRWDTARYYGGPGGDGGKSVSKWGGFLPDIEWFDPVYFGIPESVAAGVDPLARQWLEVSAEALADAGYVKDDVWGLPVGVFCGSRVSNYASRLRQLDSKAVIGVGQNFISAHLSHCYNFSGPNLIVDTACASALTAVHLAAQSICQGESELAIAGGVDILLDEGPFLLLSSAKILSVDGRCRTFDEGANGIGIGEGCGALILKPLDAALQDGDKIYGVIDGSAINSDGSTMGITTPNPQRQQQLIEQAIANAGVDASTISYVEAHGTGTLIGDPIELRSLTNALGKGRQGQAKCGVGSVKSNHGHLLSAAGAAGLIKVLLSIVHRQLPPTLHCDKPNPRFDFEQSPLYPVSQLQQWEGVAGVHRAGVSAFGLGGHNAHVILSDHGVPPDRLAGIEPRGERVNYRRKRYWSGDDKASGRSALPVAAGAVDAPSAATIDGGAESPAARAMSKYFAVQYADLDGRDAAATHEPANFRNLS
ncbi:hypothetical protein BI347_14895 [Chromobacterium sphagni]|uniref:3-hydroxyacyl-CoA dehydrogenase n=1 Tax=Chromobacterium sphagni TaxID=1903179 RepID=A0A1S1X5B1_9NEIS|nr:hypothetical protein BI347_14895 [Chromobacterium sphagni]